MYVAERYDLTLVSNKNPDQHAYSLSLVRIFAAYIWLLQVLHSKNLELELSG